MAQAIQDEAYEMMVSPVHFEEVNAIMAFGVVLEGGRPAQAAESVSFRGMEQARAVCIIGAGHCRFEPDVPA